MTGAFHLEGRQWGITARSGVNIPLALPHVPHSLLPGRLDETLDGFAYIICELGQMSRCADC